jgi:TRAP transporter 4TM/12TM fusion protein
MFSIFKRAGRKKDKEDQTVEFKDEFKPMRTLSGNLNRAVMAAGFLLGLFHLYTGFFGAFSAMNQRAVHWTVISVFAFLLYPASKGGNKPVTLFDYLWGVAAIVSGLYLLLSWERIAENAGMTNELDLIMGFMGVAVVMEATRRVVGPVLALLGLFFLLYAYFGAWIPGTFGHRRYSVERIIQFLYTSAEGIYGIPMSVSAQYAALFVLFGTILDKFGGGKLFVDLAFSLTGKLRGGAAKASVVSSALFGTVSGSAVANVVVDGVFTIPLMKRTGYKPHVAGAIEAVTSTGGQIMPPVMGAAAFIMAEITGIPYVEIMKAAALPAILYFFSLFVLVDLEAAREKIGRVSSVAEVLKLAAVLKTSGYLLAPLPVLVTLIAMDISPMKSVVWSILCILLMELVFSKKRLGLPETFLRAVDVGMRGITSVAVACACSGIIIGVISLTGLGLKFSSMMIATSGESIWIALFLTMVASLILGCGLPTTAAYVVLATMAVPALVKIGIPILPAHLFVFYFGCISTITPPVALSAYAAGAIAGANPNTVGWTAFKFSIVSFLIPYMWISGPGLLLAAPLTDIIRIVITSVIGVGAFAMGLQGFALVHCSWPERILAMAAGILLIEPGLVTDIIGAFIISIFIFLHYLNWRRNKNSSSFQPT